MTSYRELFDEVAKRHKRGEGCPCSECRHYRYFLGHELEQKVMKQECPERSNFVKEEPKPQTNMFQGQDSAMDSVSRMLAAMSQQTQWYLQEPIPEVTMSPPVPPPMVDPSVEPASEADIREWILDRLYGPNRKREEQ
jgi:hypothetical protein